ncbi:hypothetical protein SVAN01_01017 [Stagonosporopsis vannaccii]|nr:hypothetical protein SVAN01_01017 [Stagonosporopsis vannaccii]
MHAPACQTLPRRIAMTVIILLQFLHFIQQMHDRWTHPQPLPFVVITIAKLTELGFFALCSFKLVERNYDVRMGRHVIQGSGIDALLWGMAAWSAAVARGDGRGLMGEWLGLVQLVVVDIILWAEILGRGVAWVERGEEGEREVEGEGAGGERAGGEEMSEKGEKLEV